MKKTSCLIILSFVVPAHLFSQWVALDSINSAVCNISTSGNKLYVCSAISGVFISSDSGYTFSPSNNGLANLNTRFILTKDSLLVLGTNNSVYKSIDYGTSWVLASNGIPSSTNSNVEDLIFRGDSILVATFGNGIYCSLDYCQNWFPLNNGFTDLNRSCLFSNGNRLFAGSGIGGSGIYSSDDNGATWVPKNNGVPKTWVDTSKYVDITSFTMINQILFVSTHGGNVLASEDDGENWNVLGNPNNYIWTIFSCGNTLLTGHDGLGVCRSDNLGNDWNFENEGLEYLPYIDIRTFCKFGSYIYTGTGGFSNTIFRRPVSELITGIFEKKDGINTLVYPNPVSGISKLLIPDCQKEQYSLSIYSINGNLIKKIEYPSGMFFIISKCDFEKGFYSFLLKKNGSRISSGKFIVL
jgi:photosystem II stability/assembly factor-like uncharacterized protein